MIARAKPHRPRRAPGWHAGFLTMLPAIQAHAKVAFRHLDPEAKQEAVQEVTANAAVAYARLFDLGKIDLAYAGVMARFAVAQVKDGRKVGTRANVRDVSSQYAQMRKGITMERLDRYDKEASEWQEILVESRCVGPAETAACRLDFGNWLQCLPRRLRKIATTLAKGESTGKTAKKFKISPGRISQMRRELMESWEEFSGEALIAGCAVGAVA
jgi:hypothetical protein